MGQSNHFAIRLKRSGIGRCKSQRLTLQGLGLRRFGKTVHLQDTPAIRGMLYKVVHLVDVESREGPVPTKT